MYDIKPLEEEWKQYKKSQRKPYIIAATILSGIAIISLYSFNTDKSILSKFPSFSTTKVSQNNDNKVESTILVNNAFNKIQIHKKEVIETIKPIVKVHTQERIEEAIPTLPVVNNIPILDEKPKRVIVHKKIVTRKVTKPKREKPRKKMHLNIVESSSVSAYRDVEKRFYQSHDTDDSLFLAKSYFRKGNYKKSEYWALQTNKVSSNIEESWIIFVKSKVKLGHKNEAIQILNNYVKRSNSHSARNLLYKLKKN
jgi:hypothetical protein